MNNALEIANVKARYCTASDMSPVDPAAALSGFREVFTDDVVGDYGFRVFEGFDDLTGFMTTVVAGSSDWMLHMVHTPCITIDGDAATGDWTVMSQMKRSGTGQIDTVIGRYSDTFRRTPDGWKICRLRFERLA